MKLAAGLFTLAFACSAIAEPIPLAARALSDYQNIFTGISDQVAAVSSSVSAYTSGSSNADAVQTAANKLAGTINDGASAIPGFDPLQNADALALVRPIQDLKADVKGLVDSVVGAKGNFDGDGRSGDVLTALKDEKSASEALRDAITPKVPQALQGIAKGLADGIVNEINRGVEAYSG
ncbi:hydrophobic surface binding protein A-domain-containing protein [Aspergillus karnatakaensis]|uniref:cell wall mannoprotein 1 family protein n=1 Tax=Aspergillus karnatakaensis TaxID=1810916 RepID=UPI003CCE1FD4